MIHYMVSEVNLKFTDYFWYITGLLYHVDMATATLSIPPPAPLKLGTNSQLGTFCGKWQNNEIAVDVDSANDKKHTRTHTHTAVCTHSTRSPAAQTVRVSYVPVY